MSDETVEEFDKRWDSADPVETQVFRDRIEHIIWEQMVGSGTSNAGIPPWIIRAADRIWEEFTCRRCGYGVADLGVYDRRCNDCSPRIAAQSPSGLDEFHPDTTLNPEEPK